MTWPHIKNEIKNIYNFMPSNNFIYFLREAEFRLNLSRLNSEKRKMEVIYNLFREVYFLCDYNFFNMSNIMNFNNY